MESRRSLLKWGLHVFIDVCFDMQHHCGCGLAIKPSNKMSSLVVAVEKYVTLSHHKASMRRKLER